MKPKFSIGKYIKENDVDQESKLESNNFDSNQDSEIFVNIYDLKDNPLESKINYPLDYIKNLAKQLTLATSMPRIEVAKVEGEYIIWSGHRRRYAILWGLENGLNYAPSIIDKNNNIKVILKNFKAAVERDEKRIFTEEDFQILNFIQSNLGQRRDFSPEVESKEIELLEICVQKMFNYERKNGLKGISFRAFFADFLGISETKLQRYFNYRKLSSFVKAQIKENKIKFTVATDHLSSLSSHEQDERVIALQEKGIEVTEKALRNQFSKQDSEIKIEEKKPAKIEYSEPSKDISEAELESSGQIVLPEIKDDAIIENLGLEEYLLEKIPTQKGTLIILLEKRKDGYISGFSFTKEKTSSIVERPSKTDIPKPRETAIQEQILFLKEYGSADIQQALLAGKYIEYESTIPFIKTDQPNTECDPEVIPVEKKSVKKHIQQINSAIKIQLTQMDAIQNEIDLLKELQVLRKYIDDTIFLYQK